MKMWMEGCPDPHAVCQTHRLVAAYASLSLAKKFERESALIAIGPRMLTGSEACKMLVSLSEIPVSWFRAPVRMTRA